MKNQKEKIRIRFYRTNGRKTNREANGQFIKEFNSIRELKTFISNLLSSRLHSSRSYIYCVNLCEDLTPSQYQAFCQNEMSNDKIKRAIEHWRWGLKYSFNDWKALSHNSYKKSVKEQKKGIKECNKRR